MSTKNPYEDLIKRAERLLRYDFNEANEIVAGTINDLITALLNSEHKQNIDTDISIANLKVQGDRGVFEIQDIITSHDDSSINLSQDVGYGSLEYIANLIMDYLKNKFTIASFETSESEAREGGLIITFNPPIPESQFKAFSEFLGQEYY